MRVHVLVAVTFLVPTLAGCLTGDEPIGQAAKDPVVITDPKDFSYMENGTLEEDERAHLHDYWGGKDRLTVVDDTQAGGVGLWFGGRQTVAEFRPPASAVIPQGAATATVTVSWAAEQLDAFSAPELWVKTAADTGPFPVSAVANGDTVTMTLTNAQNDLPHQGLSSWIFLVTMEEGDGPTGQEHLRFQGDVSLLVVVERGLEIPLYPGHPDRWDGATEVALTADEDLSIIMGETKDGWSCFSGCPRIAVPFDGVIVPPNTKLVRAVLTQDPGAANRLGFSYHGADAREFKRLTPTSDSGTERVYDIPVARGEGDGPYAVTSLWEFLPFIEEPVTDATYAGTWSLEVTAFKHG